MSFMFRGDDPVIKQDNLYEAAIYRYRDLRDIPWSTFFQQPDLAVRIVVQASTESLPLDMLYIPRDHPRLIVGFHGAEDPRNTDFPKFQFVRSFRPARKESLLFLFDSTLLYDGAPSIGWMAGNDENHLATDYQKIVRSLVEQTNISETLLVGHSAGGTSAIRVGSRIPNSRAVAVNPQFSAELHRPWILRLLAENVFQEGQTPSSLLSQYQDRFDLRTAISNQLPSATFSWFTHRDDTVSSIEDFPHFPAVIEYLGLGPDGGDDANGNTVSLCAWETKNKNKHALPGGVLPFINVVLGEDTSLDLKIQGDTNPTWPRHRQWNSMSESEEITFRGSHPSIKRDELVDAPIYRYKSVTEVPWAQFAAKKGERVRIIIQEPGRPLPLDVLYIPRDSRRLLVGFHGAEQQAKTELPKFQFVRSLSSRQESLLFVSDSTLLLDKKLMISWMSGCPGFDVATEYARLINTMNSETGIEETVLVGHSAGGTAAVRVGTHIRHSRAISVNGQFAAEYYEKWTIPALHRYAFSSEPSPEAMLSLYRDRLHLGTALDNRVDSSTFTWFAHKDDGASFGAMPSFPKLAEHLKIDQDCGGHTSGGDSLVVCDWQSEASKHAIPGSILPFVSAVMGEPYSQDIGIMGGVDPTWIR